MLTSFWKAQQKLWQTQWMACTLICRQTARFQMSIFCNIHWHTESYKLQLEMLCHWLPMSQTIVHSDPKEMKLWLIWQWWLWDVLRALRGAMHSADVLSKALPGSNTWDNCALYILSSKLDTALSVLSSFLEVCSVWKAFELHSF